MFLEKRYFLGFDFGNRYLGVALGQNITFRAKALLTIETKKKLNWRMLELLVEKWLPANLVVGLPIRLDGTRYPIAKLAEEFSEELERRFSVEVIRINENYSTIEARHNIFTCHGARGLTPKAINAEAAKIILDDWLNRLSMRD